MGVDKAGKPEPRAPAATPAHKHIGRIAQSSPSEGQAKFPVPERSARFKRSTSTRIEGGAHKNYAPAPPRDSCYTLRMRALLLCLVPLTACTGIQQTQVFAGPQRPTAGACDPATRATLTRRGHAVTVSPADGTLTLAGTITGTTLSATTTLTGVDKKPYPVTFTGQLAGDQIEGTLTTPRCRYRLMLSATGD